LISSSTPLRLLQAALVLGACSCTPQPDALVCDPMGRADLERFLREGRGRVSPGEAHRMFLQNDKRHEDASRVLPLLELQEGMVVADLGCGVGHFTFSMARAVGPTGEVHALDVHPGYLEAIRFRMQDRRLNPHDNVRPLRSARASVELEPESVDVLLMAHMDFHAFTPLESEHQRLLSSAVHAVRPGGRLLVLQWMNLVGPEWQVSDPEATRSNLQATGLVERSAHHFEGFDTWLFSFEKPAL